MYVLRKKGGGGMADAEKLIELILSDEKLRNSKCFQTKIYNDEPIIKPASKMANYVPPEISRLQKEAFSSSSFYNSKESEFYRLAQLMEDYEDDFEYNGDFSCYYPSYRDMNTGQLRGYFSWRTKVRKGIVEKTCLSFAFVYIYELLHLIGAGSAEEGFEALRSFYEAYRSFDERIGSYMDVWLRDFVVYYGLDRVLLEELPDFYFDKAVMILENCESCTDNELFGVIKELSSYKIENSRFYREFPADVEAVVCGVYREMSEYYRKHRKNSYIEHLFGKKVCFSYHIFMSAVFYDYKKYAEYEYDVSDIQKYRCINGAWSCEKYYGSRGRSRKLGDMLKTIDCLMRQRYDFGCPINQEIETKLVLKIINKEIDKLLGEKKKNPPVVINIDVSKLGEIRAAADITRDRLIVDDETEPEEYEEPAEEKEETTEQAINGTVLDDGEYEIMRCLLYGGDFAAAAKKHGKMLSVAADSINEKLFDMFGDTVIMFEGDTPFVIEDYAEDLKGMIGR